MKKTAFFQFCNTIVLQFYIFNIVSFFHVNYQKSKKRRTFIVNKKYIIHQYKIIFIAK